ncbi:MAG: M4 family metallopeptidase [Gammaproteobacteria bacterium]|nr:M4 family metallopeptidase [Gammaproteobacteria bacterium]
MKMTTKVTLVAAIVGATFVATPLKANPSSNGPMAIQAQTELGAPSFIAGDLGDTNQQSAARVLQNIVASQAAYNANGNENFTIRRQWTDKLGKTHSQFNQTINGLRVYGTSMTIHAELDNPTVVVTTNSALAEIGANSVVLTSTDAPASVYAVSGVLAVANNNNDSNIIGLAATMSTSVSDAPLNTARQQSKKLALTYAQYEGNVVGNPELVYVYLPQSGETKLAWKIDIKYDTADSFEHDIVFFDAQSSQELTRHPQVHRAKILRTYTMDNAVYSDSSRPGRLLCSTGETCADASAQRAHSGASKVYDYYSTIHNRHSVNDGGMAVVSSVHTGSNWNNAVWYNSQMFYGDGDGSQFGDFTLSFDIIGHELTHGVTSFSANLVYRNESGALNEAMSDIMGASSDAWQRNTTQPIWSIGAAAYTPGTAGDALRYMNDPARDNSSKDYYPDRYVGTQDNGGVHWNSGIANLAYVLLVDGGTHPRNKTTVVVPGLGLAKSEKIFYRALTTYFNSSTNFAAARTGTAQAAQDLYGENAKVAVETAWCAVGVGSCPTTTPPPSSGNELTNGVAKTGLSASTGSDVTFTMEVPAGATEIKFVMNGGSGDADLYVRYGAAPTDSRYDCRPYASGNSENCNGSQDGGTYYVKIKAYQAFSNVSLTGSYTESSGPVIAPVDITKSNITVSRRQWTRFTYDLPAGYANLNVAISGGSGDADLYVRHGVQSTRSTYDCRPYKNGNNEQCAFNTPAAGTWYFDVYGYQAVSGLTLKLTATPQ